MRPPFSRPLFASALALATLTHCQKDPKGDGHVPLEVGEGLPDPLTARHVFVAAANVLSTGAQAKVLHVGLDDASVAQVLSGESADPALFATGSEVLLFNRAAGNVNVRRLHAGDAGVVADAQQSFPGSEGVGDPHAAVALPGGRLLLALYNAGKLVVMDGATGGLAQEVTADWDLPEGAPLRPDAIAAVKRGEERLFYVVHQGFAKDYTPNGTQAVFILKADAQGVVSVVDTDPAKPKVQGIALTGTAPVLVTRPHEPKPLLVSMCSPFVKNGAAPCRNAVEEVDPATDKATTLWDLEGVPHAFNGATFAGEEPTVFYAAVEGAEGAKILARYDVSAKTASTVHTYPAGSLGFWAAFFDHATKTLWIGDARGENGVFTLRKDGQEPRDVALPAPPLAVALSPF